jgi:ankyrin repeat protein
LAEINIVDDKGYTSLHHAAVAAKKGRDEIVMSLIQHGATVNFEGESYATFFYYFCML